MPASNQTGRADAAALGMVHRDVGAAQQVGDADLAGRRGGNAGEGADLDHLARRSRTAG